MQRCIPICPYISAVRAIPIDMKPTPGATPSVRASFSDEDEKHPQGDEKHPGRAVGQLYCSSFEFLNPICGKCMDLPQVKYPGMWKVSVTFPLGYIGHAGYVIARTKFVCHHPADSTRARTTLPKRCLGSVGRRKLACQKD